MEKSDVEVFREIVRTTEGLEKITLESMEKEDRLTYSTKNITHLNLSGFGIGQFQSQALLYEITKLSALKNLNLSKNRISGPIPVFLSNLNDLEVLNLSYNNLTGHIPIELGYLILLSLNLSNNNLDGILPEFKVSNRLKELDLHNNKLTGPISESLLTDSFGLDSVSGKHTFIDNAPVNARINSNASKKSPYGFAYFSRPEVEANKERMKRNKNTHKKTKYEKIKAQDRLIDLSYNNVIMLI